MLRSFLNRLFAGSSSSPGRNPKRPSVRPTFDILEDRAVPTAMPLLSNPGNEGGFMPHVAIVSYYNPKEISIDKRDVSSASRPAMEDSPSVAFSFNGFVTFGGTVPNSTRGATSAAVDLNGAARVSVDDWANKALIGMLHPGELLPAVRPDGFDHTANGIIAILHTVTPGPDDSAATLNGPGFLAQNIISGNR